MDHKASIKSGRLLAHVALVAVIVLSQVPGAQKTKARFVNSQDQPEQQSAMR